MIYWFNNSWDTSVMKDRCYPKNMLNQLNQFPTATSTPGITGLTFLRIASPRVGKVPPCRLPTRGNAILRVPFSLFPRAQRKGKIEMKHLYLVHEMLLQKSKPFPLNSLVYSFVPAFHCSTRYHGKTDLILVISWSWDGVFRARAYPTDKKETTRKKDSQPSGKKE